MDLDVRDWVVSDASWACVIGFTLDFIPPIDTYDHDERARFQ